MSILDRIIPSRLGHWWDTINAARTRAENREATIQKLHGESQRLIIHNHLGERLALAFQPKERQ